MTIAELNRYCIPGADWDGTRTTSTMHLDSMNDAAPTEGASTRDETACILTCSAMWNRSDILILLQYNRNRRFNRRQTRTSLCLVRRSWRMKSHSACICC